MLARIRLFLFVTAASLVAVPGLRAAPVSGDEVIIAVETWLREVVSERRLDAAVERLEPVEAGGRTVAHVAHLAAGGYCLCGADDLLLPVYLYVPEGAYDPSVPDLRGILEEIGDRLTLVEEGLAAGDARILEYRDLLDERARTWTDLSRGRIPSRILADKGKAAPTMMRLPLDSVWHQGSPYNDDCPAMPGEAPSIVGCVATAMSQIMRYWEWPVTGYSSHNATFSYRRTATWIGEPLSTDPGITDAFWSGRLQWTSMDGGYLQMFGNWDASMYNSARDISTSTSYRDALLALYNRLTPATQNHYVNFAATTYDFDLMRDEHTDPVDAGDEAVAELCYHAGVALDMNWGLHGSGSVTGNVGNVLEAYFRYDADNVYATLDTDVLVEEVRWLRPVEIRGGSTTGGHAWVVSGYDLADPIHPSFWMNMGWGPGSNGWFTLDEVPSSFVFDQAHVARIAPAGMVRFIGPDGTPSGDGSPADPYDSIADALIEIPDHGTLIFKAGTDHVWAAGGVIDRPMTVKGVGVTISAP